MLMTQAAKADNDKLAKDKTDAITADDKPKKAALTEPELEGARAFLGREFPGVKFSPPKSDDDAGDKDKGDEKDKKTKDVAPKKGKAEDAKPNKKDATPTKPAARKPPTAPPPLTADQIAEAAARGTAKAMTDSKTATDAKPDKSAKPAEDALSAGDRRKVAVLRHMESVNPDRYKGVADRFVSSTVALDTYAKKWEEANPGETFDEEAPEHEAFFKSNDVDWDDDDFHDAAVDMRVSKALESKPDKTAEELETLKKKVELQESAAVIGTQQTTAAIQFWGKLGDDFKDVVSPDGQVNQAKLAEMQKADPESYATRIRAAQALNTETAEIYKIYNGLVTFQPNTNVVHRAIRDFGAEMETIIQEQPAEDQLDSNGRPFVSSDNYHKLSPAERDKHWTLTADDLITMRAARLARLVNQQVEAAEEAHRRWAESRGIKLPDAAAADADATAGKQAAADKDDDDDSPDRQDKPRGPSSTGDSRGAATQNGKSGTIPSGARIASLL